MTQPDIAAFENTMGQSDSELSRLSWWEVALYAVSRLGVVFALALALILILGHQMGRPV
jgi:hypothetical protein